MAESEITLYPLIIMKMRNLLTVSLVVLFCAIVLHTADMLKCYIKIQELHE